MRELSLHVLDIIENSIRANAAVISLLIDVSLAADLFTIRIEDDGPGFTVSPEVLLDPFHTTKPDKRVGLGLSLLQSAAQRAGGRLTLGRSSFGGASVEARMQLSHVDRAPLGNLADTISAIVCANAGVDLRLCLQADGRQFTVSSKSLASTLPPSRRSSLAVAQEIAKQVQAGAAQLWPGQSWWIDGAVSKGQSDEQ